MDHLYFLIILLFILIFIVILQLIQVIVVLWDYIDDFNVDEKKYSYIKCIKRFIKGR